MKLKFLTSLIAAGVMLVGSSAFALTDAQQASINAAINASSTTDLATVAAAQLTANSGDAGAISFIINAAKAKLGANASISSVRNLVNALVQAAPLRAGSIVQQAGSAFPSMKANIASAAQAGLSTAAAAGKVTATQANSVSGQVNSAAGIGTAVAGRTSGGSPFQANAALAQGRASAEFQRLNQNNYRTP